MVIGGAYNITLNTNVTVASLTLSGSGILTQSANLTITGAYAQSSTSSFICIAPATYSFSAGDFGITAGTFRRYTGTGISADPYIIRDVYDLQAMQCSLTSFYQLNGNISASATSGWNSGALASCL